MPRVNASIEEQVLTNDSGQPVPGVVATCSKCGEQTESFGTGEKSRKRCLVLLKENCPNEENNFYVDEDADE